MNNWFWKTWGCLVKKVDMKIDMVLDIELKPRDHAMTRMVCQIIDFVLNKLVDLAMTGVIDFVIACNLTIKL